MSEAEDADARTEEPTEKKLQDAFEKGQDPVSREVAVALGFLAALTSASLLTGSVSARLTSNLMLALSNAAEIRVRDANEAAHVLHFLASQAGEFLFPTVGALAAAGVTAAVVQAPPRIAFHRVAVDFSRISPVGSWGRIFGARGFREIAKTAIKCAIASTAIFLYFRFEGHYIGEAMRSDPHALPAVLRKLIVGLLSWFALTSGVWAMVDVVLTRMRWRRDMRMSRQEIKQELRETEGDATVKARMRSLAQSRARKRMMAAVPNATLIIANPTHYAIALRYRRERDSAPVVVAKGQDILALKIREIAESAGVPVLEKKELVRAMYDLVEVDKIIPKEFYRPIAELIHFLMQLGHRL